MCHRVNNAEETDHDPRDLMEVYVMIERHDGVEAVRSQKRDALAQHQDQNERAIEVQALTCNTIYRTR